jgi:hypothetical protein
MYTLPSPSVRRLSSHPPLGSRKLFVDLTVLEELVSASSCYACLTLYRGVKRGCVSSVDTRRAVSGLLGTAPCGAAANVLRRGIRLRLVSDFALTSEAIARLFCLRSTCPVGTQTSYTTNIRRARGVCKFFSTPFCG